MNLPLSSTILEFFNKPWHRRITIAVLLTTIIIVDPLVDALVDPGHPFFSFETLIVSAVSGIAGLIIIIVSAYLASNLTHTKIEMEALKQHFEYLSKYANDVVVLVDENWKIIDSNDRAVSMYGYTREELFALNPVMLRIPEEREKLTQQLSQLDFENGAVFESMHQRKDGSTFPVEVNARIYTRGGKKYFWSIVRDISDRKASKKAIRLQRDRLRELVVRIENIREEERNNLARVLHDGLSQELTAIKMNIATLASRAKHDDVMTDKIHYLRELIDTSIHSSRKISLSLRPVLLDEVGLNAAIEWHVRDFEKNSGISCTYKIEREKVALKTGLPIALFRILQESLTNVVRHANASIVAVNFEVKGKDVELTIFDNGKGIRADYDEAKGAFGIMGMKERAIEFGGTVTIERLKVKGTRVIARIPEALL